MVDFQDPMASSNSELTLTSSLQSDDAHRRLVPMVPAQSFSLSITNESANTTSPSSTTSAQDLNSTLENKNAELVEKLEYVNADRLKLQDLNSTLENENAELIKKLEYVNADRLKLRDLNSTLENKVLSLTKALTLEKERSMKQIAEPQSSQATSSDDSMIFKILGKFDSMNDKILEKLDSMRFLATQQHQELKELCANWESIENQSTAAAVQAQPNALQADSSSASRPRETQPFSLKADSGLAFCLLRL